jgi:hypothetical protein
MVRAGVGTRRMARNQVEDFKPIFDRAQTIFERTFVSWACGLLKA